MNSPFRFFTTVAKQLLVASVLVGIGLIVSPAGAAEIIAPTSFPDDVVPEGATGYSVPIKIVGPTTTGVIGIDVNLQYNVGLSGGASEVLTATSIVKGAALSSWFTPIYNIIPGEPDEIRVSLAANNSANALNLAAGETVIAFYVVFDAVDATVPTPSPLLFTKSDLNEVVTDNNNASLPEIKLGGATGVLTVLPDPILPAQSVLITLTDADLNQNSGAQESVDITVERIGGESQTVTLDEDGNDSSLFIGQIATAYGDPEAGITPELEVKSGDQIKGTYADDLGAEGDAPSAAVTIDVDPNDDGSVAILNGAPINQGDQLEIQVLDDDLNNDPNVAETILVTVYNQTTGEWETILLTETGPDTGDFRAFLPTDGTSTGDGDGTLAVFPGDQLVVRYDDPIGADGAPHERLSLTPTDGSFTSLPTAIKVADVLSIVVTDVDLSTGTRIDGAASVEVTVATLDGGGDSQIVTLTELDPSGNPGVLTGTLPTTYDNGGGVGTDGAKLELRPGYDVTFTYNDRLGDSGTAEDLDSGSTITVDGTDGTVVTGPSVVSTPGSVTITVDDIDLSGATGVTVSVWVMRKGGFVESEIVALTETDPVGNPGVFTGNINAVIGSPAANSQLDVQVGDQIVGHYVDAFDASLATNVARYSVDFTGGQITDVFTPIDVGDVLTIQVTDDDMKTANGATRVDGPGELEVTVTVVDGSSNPEDFETVLLTETGTGTGIFEGSINTIYDADDANPSNGNNSLELRIGYGVTVDFAEVATGPDGGPSSDQATVTIDPGTTGTVEITNASPVIDPVTDDVELRVTDADLNDDPLVNDTVTITVKNITTGEIETVLLTETGPNTGIFEASLPTSGTAPDATIGTLGLGTGDQIVAIYDDAIGGDGLPHPGLLSLTPLTAAFTPIADIKVSFDLIIQLTDDDMKTANGATRSTGSGQLTVDVTVEDAGTNLEDQETVTLTETGTGTGIFEGSITTVYDADDANPSGVGGELELRPGYEITVTYDDPLGTGTGAPTVVTEVVSVINGTTGTLVASEGVQDGDELRIEVDDADLNLDVGAVEFVDVTVASGTDFDTIQLEETGDNTGIFRKAVPTSSGGAAADDGTVQVVVTAVAGNITVTYVDAVVFDGSEVTVPVGVTGVIWGDASKNGFRGALDASWILQRSVLLITFDDYQNVVGNVDNSSPTIITANDATFVLRKVVGLDPDPANIGEPRFPVQFATSNNHPFKRTLDERMIALGEPALRGGLLSLPVVMDETEGLLSGQMRLKFDPQQYRIAGVVGTEATADYMFASNVVADELLIAFAGAEGHSKGTDSILEIRLEVLGNGVAATPLTFEKVDLNGGRIQATSVESAAAFVQPQAYSLLQNWPNPFNPETSLRYSLPAASRVTLTVFDMLGQKVRILVDQQQAAGTYSVQWNGRDESGQSVASGLYLYRIEAGQFAQTRKMTLLR